MKLTKKILVLMLSSILLVTACSTPNDSPDTEVAEISAAYTAGTYSATATGYGGPLSVEVTVDENSITDIELVEFNDTVMLGDTAFETISGEVLEHQTLNVDSVSGATVSSAAVRTAIRDALADAGADIDALRAKEIPQDEPGELNWETDVLVIGSGISGMSAAIEAAENGADVIMIEKLGRLGGTTALSAGWVHGAGTSIQEKNNIEDSEEQFHEHWMMLAERDKDEYIDEDMIRHITYNSAENIEWLMDQGVEMMDDLFAPGIYEGRNIPRIHQTEGGNGYISKYLFDAVEEAGVKTYVNTPATELIKEGNAVVGAKATDKAGNDITITADAVIIASGGFAGNKEMMAEYYPQYTDYENFSVNEGDSLIMGEAVGADIIVKNALQLHHNLSTDTSLGYFTPESIYVTPEGDRYVDEAEYFYTRTRALNELGFGDTHMIIPHKLYENHKEGIDKAMERDIAFEADTIEELAEMMDMNPETLKNTINRYNDLVEKGNDEDFNKPSEYLLAIGAPYMGLDLTGNLNDTYTSLRINIDAQVIDTEGNVINGLYAAGGAASSQTLNQEYIGSGSALLNGLTYGRAAGAHAATNLNQ